MQAVYELSQLRQGWKETETNQEDAALSAIQSLTGWSADQAENAFMQSQWRLGEAEQRTIEEKADEYYNQHGKYPTKPFHPHCKVDIDGYIVSRKRVKTVHCSESSRMKYTWEKA